MQGINTNMVSAMGSLAQTPQKEDLAIGAMKKAIDTQSQQILQTLESAQPNRQISQRSQIVAEMTGMGQTIDIKG